MGSTTFATGWPTLYGPMHPLKSAGLTDRAQYGEKLLKKPEEAFMGAEGMDERAFRYYRKFDLTYWGLLRYDKTNHNS